VGEAGGTTKRGDTMFQRKGSADVIWYARRGDKILELVGRKFWFGPDERMRELPGSRGAIP